MKQTKLISKLLVVGLLGGVGRAWGVRVGDYPWDIMVTISLMACKRRFVDSFLAPS